MTESICNARLIIAYSKPRLNGVILMWFAGNNLFTGASATLRNSWNHWLWQ